MTRRVLVVLQSRLSSSRLPGKAMLSLGGQPMVVLAARRAGRDGAEVVVATSDRPEDEVIARGVEAAGIRVVRGPLDDPLARFVLAAADLSDDDVVVRLTADNVFPDGALVTALADGIDGSCHYARVGGADEAMPYGVAGEAFTVRALREADRNATEGADREHVTPWIRRNHGDTVLRPEPAHEAWRGLRCTIDTFDDYVAVARLLSTVPDPIEPTWWSLADRLAEAAEPAAPVWRHLRPNALDQSPLVLGTVQLGLAYGAANETGLPDDERAHEVLLAATGAGVTHLDTARAYGISEARIGRALARGLSERAAIITKVRPLDDLPTDAPPAWCDAAVRASVETSLRHLSTSRVDALLLHRAADWLKGGGAVRDSLVRLRDEGTCRVVGVSLSSPSELLRVLDDPSCGYVQLPFNLLDRRWARPEVQQALAARPDVIVTARSVYLQGLLVGGEHVHWPGNVGIDRVELQSALMTLADELGRSSVADLCLAFVLGHPWVTSVVLGAETPEQVRDSAMLARNAPLTLDELEHARAALPRVSETLLDPSRWKL